MHFQMLQMHLGAGAFLSEWRVFPKPPGWGVGKKVPRQLQQHGADISFLLPLSHPAVYFYPLSGGKSNSSLSRAKTFGRG